MIPTDNQPCADPARLDIFQNLSSFFLRESETVIGTCGLCGKDGIAVLKANKAGVGTCAAQSALTQKRDTVEDGHPLAFGAPTKPGRFSLTDTFVGILVGPDKSVFTGKVAPTRPLPNSVVADSALSFADLLDAVMKDPPASFYIAYFNKKADVPFMRSDADEFFINGTQAPIRIDRARLQQLVALLEEFGYRAVATARELKDKMTPMREAKLRAWVEKNAPDLLGRMREAPYGEEPEFEFASLIVNNRAKRATITS